jgi:hypothetical protein
MSEIAQISVARASFLALLLIFVNSILSAGCGENNSQESGGSTGVISHAGSIQACLKKNGAIEAVAPEELGFLAAAESNEEVSKFAFAYDKKAGILVHVWSKARQDGRPPQWMIWIGHASVEVPSPESILLEDLENSFVMYVREPSPSVRRGVESCISLDSSQNEEKMRFHSIKK